MVNTLLIYADEKFGLRVTYVCEGISNLHANTTALIFLQKIQVKILKLQPTSLIVVLHLEFENLITQQVYVSCKPVHNSCSHVVTRNPF